MLEILTLVAGPAGGFVALFLILWGLYKISEKHLIPTVKEFLTKIVDEHREDRITYQETISDLKEAIGLLKDGVLGIDNKVEEVDKRLEKVEEDVQEIKEKIDG